MRLSTFCGLRRDQEHLTLFRKNHYDQRKQKYKEAQAAPLPPPIGGIDVKCGSCALDYPSARPLPPPPPVFQGVVKIFFL
jgi:hypothetical protein